MFTKALALLLFPALAVAQYGAPPGPSTPSSTSAPSAASGISTAPADTPGQMNINVTFNGALVFSPPNITASVGTLVTFYFPNSATKHSVTQSSFANPCTYLAANTSTNAPAGFDSDLTSDSTFTLNVTDTNPIWFYCKQLTHCGLGMVGSINANTTVNTFEEFQAAAKALNGNEPTTPSNNGPVIAGVHATATGPPVPDGTSSSSSPSSSPTSGAMKVTASIGFTLFAAILAVAMA